MRLRLPFLNFKEITKKDIFLRRLKGSIINFKYVMTEDKLAFFDFAVKTGLVEFMFRKEYRGILGQYKVLSNFNINFEDPLQSHLLTFSKGETIELTEQLTTLTTTRFDYGLHHHKIYVYVSKKERIKIYDL